jgi:hypothetical protein
MVSTDELVVRRNARRRWMEGAAGAAAGATSSAAIASIAGLSVMANVAAPIVGTVVGALVSPMIIRLILHDRDPLPEAAEAKPRNDVPKSKKL